MSIRRAFEVVLWLIRKRSPALKVMRIGFGCVALAFAAGMLFDVSMPLLGGTLKFRIDTTSGPPAALVSLLASLGLILIVYGLVQWRIEQSTASRAKVIAIEGRGLRDTTGTPLVSAIPEAIDGRRHELLVDIRQRIEDGVVSEPSAALTELSTLPRELRRQTDGLDRRDIRLVYGGLMPVPFTFLTGVLLDDEGPIVVLDWDRHAEAWRALDASDDGKRFQSADLTGLDGQKEVALVLSASYLINRADVAASIGNLPIVEFRLEGGNPDAHWSEAKQQALGQQFLELMVELGSRGTRRLHLFLACQNSLAFRFGRLYDRRNLPEVAVYQFERGRTPPYPWGVLMPAAGIKNSQIIQTA